MGYLQTTEDFYKQVAESPEEGLCCTSSPVWKLPDLTIPEKMLSMNYGCGTTVHPRDFEEDTTVLYVGIGGGMELLQFAYFLRNKGAVIGVDTVPEMIAVAKDNLMEAEKHNQWFNRDFVKLELGDTLKLPVYDETIDLAAQNCLFNILEESDLKKAIAEMYRILKPRGRLVLSDPITPREIPEHLRKDERLRAMCLSGAQTFDRYLELLVEAGFGTIEIRARRPYRILDKKRYQLEEPILLESVEIAAIKEPIPDDGACIFAGSTAIYFGEEEIFDDGKGHVLTHDIPFNVCIKTAAALKDLGREDLHVTGPTWFYDGGGCC